MIEQFQLIDDSCGVGFYQNIYMTAWWDEATTARLTALREHRKGFLSGKTGGLFSLSLLYQTKLKVMPKESRKMIEQINLDGGDLFVGEAYYVKAGGLLISSMRFLLAGVRLVNKLKAPLEVFNDVNEAARWIASQNKMDEKVLVGAVDEFVKRCGK